MDECTEWLSEARDVFPKLGRKVIFAEYKAMSRRKLGFVRARIERKADFDAEALLLGGGEAKIRKRLLSPAEFNIFIR
ncbi:MAG: hypothetical protein V1676_02500 [Candidatus Diapherotrites archaeon]